jgi:hypothetical protein
VRTYRILEKMKKIFLKIIWFKIYKLK